ncbi:MAG: hypothetical protein DRG25_06405, partial [Deltaproteobacteria bacterium]
QEKNKNEKKREAEKGTSKKGKNGEEQEPKYGGKEEKNVARAHKMTPKEAERWLKSLDDDQQEILKKQLQRQFSDTYFPEKDW